VGMNANAAALTRDSPVIQDGFVRANTDQSDVICPKLVRCGVPQVADVSILPKHAFPVIRRPRAPLLIYSAPLPISAGDRFRRACWVLTVVDPDAVRPPMTSDLCTTFGLTNSEAAIAVELCAGNDLYQIAAKRQVTTGTLRVQLKRILFKTSTRRQSELVALVMASTTWANRVAEGADLLPGISSS